MTWQDAVVGAIVLAALFFLGRAWVGPRDRPKRPPGPDVPADRLVRKKRERR